MEFIKGESFSKIKGNNIYYSHTHDVNNFFKNLPTSDDFILISHNSDGFITDNPTRDDCADINLMPQNLKKWYGQNVNVIHEKIVSIPIGLENSQWFKEIRKEEKIKNILNTSKNEDYLLYINHNIDTNKQKRQIVYDIFKDKNYATCVYGRNGSNFDNYLNSIYNHKFVICPEGNGIDTHRLWETLYLGSIPIVLNSINTSFYKDLPILFIDNYEELTEDYLLKNYEIIKNKTYCLDKMNMEYYYNLFQNI